MMAPACTGAQTQRRCAVRATPGVLNPNVPAGTQFRRGVTVLLGCVSLLPTCTVYSSLVSNTASAFSSAIRPLASARKCTLSLPGSACAASALSMPAVRMLANSYLLQWIAHSCIDMPLILSLHTC